MYKIIIKFLTSLLCIVIASSHISEYKIAIAILIGVSVSFIIDIVKIKYATMVYVLFFIASVVYPSLVFAYPVVLQAAAELKAVFLLVPIIGFLAAGNYSAEIALLCSMTYLISHILQKYENEKAKDEMKYYEIKLEAEKEKLEKIQSIDNIDKDIRIAILSERNRIAREIHDSVGHTISGAIIQTEAMRANADDSLNQQIDSVQANLKRGMSEIRSSLHAIHDKSLDLHLALQDIISTNDAVNFELNYSVDSELTYRAKHSIVSIVKESISNALKHANANNIKISIIEMPLHLNLSIADDGAITDIDNRIHKGIGFYSFEKFADEYNGRFNYEITNGLQLTFILKKEDMIDRS